MTWNIEKVEIELSNAYATNSEQALLKVLKENTFLFYELYFRHSCVCPCFCEVPFGNKYRCDFCWLNNNSDGPEWTIVEIEAPKMRLFNKDKSLSRELSHAIEQVKSWQRYFDTNPTEKSRIFGAVTKFRWILVAGSTEEWNSEHAKEWRKYNNSHADKIEIRTSNVFLKALEQAKHNIEEMDIFQGEHPKCLPASQLESYWKNYGYIDCFR